MKPETDRTGDYTLFIAVHGREKTPSLFWSLGRKDALTGKLEQVMAGASSLAFYSLEEAMKAAACDVKKRWPRAVF